MAQLTLPSILSPPGLFFSFPKLTMAHRGNPPQRQARFCSSGVWAPETGRPRRSKKDAYIFLASRYGDFRAGELSNEYISDKEMEQNLPSATSTEPDSAHIDSDSGSQSQVRGLGNLGLWARDLLTAIVVSLLIITFLYQPVRVEGTSMAPRLEDSDRLFINKFVYRFSSIERGDVVVFHYPRDPEKSYIKRVIAEPGDRLRIQRGKVWLNGRLLPEPYIPEEYQDSRSLPEIVVPPGYYFMMGDHRTISSDSRDFGPVSRNLVYGKAVFVYWPTQDAGAVR